MATTHSDHTQSNDTTESNYTECDHYGQPIHSRTQDRWSLDPQPGLTVAVDAGNCIVVHTRHGTFTVSDVILFAKTLLVAKAFRDSAEGTGRDPSAARLLYAVITETHRQGQP